MHITNLNQQSILLSAEIELARTKMVEAEVKLAASQDEAAEVQKKVNEATACRHCRINSTLYFESDGTLRCICRTRY